MAFEFQQLLKQQKKLSKSTVTIAVLLLISSSRAAYDTACDVGYYLSGGYECLVCTPGNYCPGGKSTVQAPCPSGTFSSFAASSCTTCPAGFQCTSPSAMPLPCPANQYSGPGATSCSACPAGAICKTDGTLEQCTAPEYCVNGQVQAQKCPPGYSCTTGSATQCASGQISLLGEADCFDCPAGYECPSIYDEPRPCGAGYWQDEIGRITACSICPTGHSCSDASKAPTACAPGTYSPIQGVTTCFDCPAGSSCSDATTFPSPCAEGTYSLLGDGSCSPCPAGSECPDRASVSPCSAGEYSLQGSGVCQVCPAGYFCPSTSKAPVMCSPGYQSDGGVTACSECAAGQECPGPNPTKNCYDGSDSAAGQGYCETTPPGTVASGGSATACGDGQMTNVYGTQCVDCPAGYACPLQTFASMVPCPSGTYSLAGELICTVSPVGKETPKTTEAPIDCPDGYQADLGASACEKCPAGFECKDNSSRHNVLCPPGSYYTETGCTECEAGKFCPLAIGGYRTAGIDCPDGSFSEAGWFECLPCPPGKDCSSKTEGPTAPDCAYGTYNVGGNMACIDCPKNHQCNEGTMAVPCPLFFTSYFADPGTYAGCEPCRGYDCTNYNPNEDPVECQPGYYNDALDFNCMVCPKGHMCATAQTIQPTKCPGGTFAIEGSDSCTTCPEGFYSLEGSEYCTPVPPGYRINDTGDGLTICEHKTYSQWGQTTCETCPDGYLCPQKTGDPYEAYQSCPRGSYCQGGVEIKCPVGTYGTMERAIDQENGCATCPAGYNCIPGTPDFILAPCPRGAYCPAGSAMIPCPSGTAGPNMYSKSIGDCFECPNGHQCAENTPDTGDICDMGYYCPQGSGVHQYPCPAGTHGAYRTGKRDLSECLPCPPGHYCPEASGSPTEAPEGYYSPLSGLTRLEDLYKCPPSFYCPNTGMTSYKGYFCEAGKVCPAGTGLASTMVPCEQGTFSDRRDLYDVSQCDLCPKGYKCDEGATTVNGLMAECQQHEYCPEGTRMSYTPKCPAGTYAPYTRSMSKVDCLPCPVGQYCEEGAGPQQCPAGAFCPAGSGVPIKCDQGFYNPDPGAWDEAQCLHCGINKQCPDFGMTNTQSCPAGTYNDYTTSAVLCDRCPAGSFCDGTTLHPTKCPPGAYSDWGAQECSYCPVGTFCYLYGTTADDLKVNLCPKGTLCLRQETILSVLTDVGLDVYPNTLDHACPRNGFCPKGTTAVLSVPRGLTQVVKARGALDDAILIPAGFYINEGTVCTDTDNADPTVDFCPTECPAGYYCPEGTFDQVPCPAGTYRADTLGRDVTDCGACPSGYFCQTPGTSAPVICPTGHFCTQGSITPSKCPIGTYNPTTGVTDSRGCTGCDAGYYCPLRGQESIDTVNNQCDAGFICYGGSYRPEPMDYTTGERCPAGGYCLQGGATVTYCPTGSFGIYKGAFQEEDCLPCWAGYYCNAAGGSGASTLCPAGSYCEIGTGDPTVDAGTPIDGQYTTEGQQQPLDCPRGYYSSVSGATACISCDAGYFCDGYGLSGKEPATITSKQKPACPLGYYCPSYNYFINLGLEYRNYPCPKGTYSETLGLTAFSECTDCPATFACDEEGMNDAANLQTCAAGYFCKKASPTRFPFFDVSSGNYGPCPAGHYCEAGTEDPEPCPTGTYSDQERATSQDYCLPCPPGFQCVGTGLKLADIVECPYGVSCTDGLTQNACTDTDKYCPLGTHEALFCPTGYYQDTGGKGKCNECPAGKYCLFGAILACPAGYYCP